MKNSLFEQVRKFEDYIAEQVEDNDDYVIKKDFEKVTVEIPSYVYTGSPITPKITVNPNCSGIHHLVYNKEYKYKIYNNISVGRAKIEITGIGDFGGTINKAFQITPKNIKTAKVTLTSTSFNYTGQAIEPIVEKVTDGTKTIPASNYTISYSNNTSAGQGTVTITGKGNYTGKISKTFNIVNN